MFERAGVERHGLHREIEPGIVRYGDGDHDHDRAVADAFVDETAGGHARGSQILQHDDGDHQDRDRANRRGAAARLFEKRIAARS